MTRDLPEPLVGSTADAEPRPDAEVAPPRGLRLLVLLPIIVFLGLAALFGIRLFSGDPARLPSALIGQAAPPTDLPALSGLRLGSEAVPGWSSASLKTDGRVTLVNVWASWCAPCQEEHPTLTQLAATNKSVRLVGLNYKDNPENARRFLGTFGNPFAAVGTDNSGKTAIDWGVYGVPETFVISRDGVIRYKQVGPLNAANLPAFLEQVRLAATR
jgi:cytochrome c biogenesis protein CcmG/thiol:disulfide interchange protein DsbE